MNQLSGGDDLIGMRCLVSGRVQGVLARASARAAARRLGLSGYARNLIDGRVEVRARGPRAAVAALRDWLRLGPPLARVEALACEPVPYQALSGFLNR